MIQRIAFMTLAAAALLLGACVKYTDGPFMSLRSKQERVANNWKAGQVFRNNLDETDRYEVFGMNFTKAGRLTWQIQLRGQPLVETAAAWELASVKEQVKLTFDLKDPVTGETRLLFMDIRRLAENELWLQYLSEGDYYEVRLVDN
ncbi:MAG: hypothetical protein NW241_10450 [Bacteroidia bacterium]|nr:hypothetical protein [Bacteroidia bacterium]